MVKLKRGRNSSITRWELRKVLLTSKRLRHVSRPRDRYAMNSIYMRRGIRSCQYQVHHSGNLIPTSSSLSLNSRSAASRLTAWGAVFANWQSLRYTFAGSETANSCQHHRNASYPCIDPIIPFRAGSKAATSIVAAPWSADFQKLLVFDMVSHPASSRLRLRPVQIAALQSVFGSHHATGNHLHPG